MESQCAHDVPNNRPAKIRWDSIDYLKGLACLAVVFLHVHFPRPMEWPVVAACRFAVPLFLVVSGFFFTSGGTCSFASTGRKLRHSLMLGIRATVALAFLVLVQGWLDPRFSATGFFRSHATAKDVACFFITNAPPSPLVHLWFLWALVYCYLFALIWFGDGNRLWTAGPLGLVLLVGMVLFQEFAHCLPFNPAIPFRGMPVRLCFLFVFRALPFFLLGIWIRRNEAVIRKLELSAWTYAAVAFAGAVAAAVEYRLFGNSQFYLGNYLTAIALFAWAIRHPEGGWKPMVFIGRRLSLLVYVLHVAVWQYLSILLRGLHVDQWPLVRWTLPCIIVALSLFIAFVLDWAWRCAETTKYIKYTK